MIRLDSSFVSLDSAFASPYGLPPSEPSPHLTVSSPSHSIASHVAYLHVYGVIETSSATPSPHITYTSCRFGYLHLPSPSMDHPSRIGTTIVLRRRSFTLLPLPYLACERYKESLMMLVVSLPVTSMDVESLRFRISGLSLSGSRASSPPPIRNRDGPLPVRLVSKRKEGGGFGIKQA